jgi:hypothetical protein
VQAVTGTTTAVVSERVSEPETDPTCLVGVVCFFAVVTLK